MHINIFYRPRCKLWFMSILPLKRILDASVLKIWQNIGARQHFCAKLWLISKGNAPLKPRETCQFPQYFSAATAKRAQVRQQPSEAHLSSNRKPLGKQSTAKIVPLPASRWTDLSAGRVPVQYYAPNSTTKTPCHHKNNSLLFPCLHRTPAPLLKRKGEAVNIYFLTVSTLSVQQ